MKNKASRQRSKVRSTPQPIQSITVAHSPFVGSWIGETMGYEGSPAHIWEIKEQGTMLRIQTKWEGETGIAVIHAWLIPGEDAFMVTQERKGFLIDPQHFWVAGWDTNDIRDGKGPHYDVVFSRPGLAELSAKEAYEKVKKKP